MPNGSTRRRAAPPVAALAALALGVPLALQSAGAFPAGSVAWVAHTAPRTPQVALASARFEPSVASTPSIVAAGGAAAAAVAAEGLSDGKPTRGQDLRSHAATPGTYVGRNRLWIPALGISRPVHVFPCSRSQQPANFVYRWGCAGSNNVYLLGHAWGVMKPLHDAYTAGRLRVGMLALYADGNGNIRAYEVTEWRVVKPTDALWAIASQPVPSMTLQTCVGPNGSLRLNVRLVEVPM